MAVEWLLGAAGSWALGKGLDKVASASRSALSGITSQGTTFLNHDPQFANQCYAEVSGKLGEVLPYQEIADFSDHVRHDVRTRITAQVRPEPFYTQATDFEWAQARARAYLDYRAQGHAGSDSPVMRVESAAGSDDGFEVVVRPTRYFCQAESNLVLDQPVDILTTDKRKVSTSLRRLLMSGAHGKLPTLSDIRLANSLGVVVCFLSKNPKGEISVRMAHRTNHVGVFPSGIHPAMSCAIKWPDKNPAGVQVDLMDLIENDVEGEIKQETGLEPGQYTKPVPLSFCREFLRAGKPQLFLLSYTDLPERALNEARDRQMRLNKQTRPEKVEVLGSGILSSRDPSTKVGDRLPKGLTHEGAACLFMVERLLRR